MRFKSFKADSAHLLRARIHACKGLGWLVVSLALLSLSACAKRSPNDTVAPPAAYEAYLRVQIEMERSEPNLHWALAQARALARAYPGDPAVQALLARVQERLEHSSRVSVQTVHRRT